jgi:biopolymer transport protein ExbB
MLELVTADGWLMIPLLVCSVITVGIIAERFWSIETTYILPPKVS